MKMCVEKGLKLGPAIEFSTRCFLSGSFCPKNRSVKWNNHSVTLIWLRMTSVWKSKVCLKGAKISGHLHRKNVTTSLNAVPQHGAREIFPTVAELLA
jgi:hypothetical protein